MNKKMVAIVSCYFQNNYGSILQSYATQEILDKLGYKNETISIKYIKKEINKRKRRYFICQALTSRIGLVKIGIYLNRLRCSLINDDYSKNIKIRNKALQRFREKNVRLSEEYRTIDELTRISQKRYNSVLVGSDQLWLPGNIVGDYFTLNWVPDNINKISYSTSFGQERLPKHIIGKANSFLRRINNLSVREESGVEIIRNITGQEASIVCDPVFLLTKTEWESRISQKKVYNEPYIFCYFLGKCKKHREFAKKLGEEKNLKIVALINIDEYVYCDNGYADDTPYNIDPFEFVNLIYNAEYICTDSFHCASFSIIFEKNFFIFQRYREPSIYSTNQRITNLKKMLLLNFEVMNGNETVTNSLMKKLDYTKTRVRLKEIRENSLNFLIQAIEGIRDND